MSPDAPLALSGTLWFEKSGHKLFAADRIALLSKIHELGSITQAAKAVGISYKTAWDLVNLMNNLADRPLVARSAGGKGGGGTSLTEEGQRLLHRFETFTREHQRFLESLDRTMEDGGDFYAFLRRMSMRVSARNVLGGTISQIQIGAINVLVELRMKGGTLLKATITHASAEALNLRVSQNAYALIKASAILLGTHLHEARLSADNLLCGTIQKIQQGAVNTEVDLDLGSGNTLSAVITQDSAQMLGLQEGLHACAAFSAASVLIGVG